jgi:hypothetical protein
MVSGRAKMLELKLVNALLAVAIAAPCCGRVQSGDDDDADVSADEVTEEADIQESDAAEWGEDDVETTDATGDVDAFLDAEDLPEDSYVSERVTLPFDLSVSGSGSWRVGSVALEHGWGPVQLGEAVPALAYMRTRWEEFNITLYHVLAPETDDLDVLYLYCGLDAPESLDVIWSESYTASMANEDASGSCLEFLTVTTIDVELMDLRSLPSPSELVAGFSVSGPEVGIGDAGGSITLEGRNYAAYPFETVDCTTICTADPADGWWELHMVLDEAGEADRCFGILYILLAELDRVQFAYGFCLRSLTAIDPAWLAAAWSAPSGGGGPGMTPAGPRHPRFGYVLRPRPPVAP